MADILCLGEILVDWVCTTVGLDLDHARVFTKAAGGAPANVAVGLARQGTTAAFLGRVSTDSFGRWLKSILEEEGIDTSGTVVDADAQTRMAYVVTDESGDRKLAEFSRISVADANFCPADLKESQFAGAKALHFGSIGLISASSEKATHAAVQLARQNHLLVSYDPNVRIDLWPSPAVCRRTILSTLKLADLVKTNLEEMHFLTGSRDIDAAEKLRKEQGIPLLIITLDKRGACFLTDTTRKIVPGFEVSFVEATGAGDGFAAGILSGLLGKIGSATDKRHKLLQLKEEDLSEIVRVANAIGALACTRPGAIPALPTLEEVKSFLAERDVEMQVP